MDAQFAHGSGGICRYYRCTKRLGPCAQKYLQERELAEQIKIQLQSVGISEEWHAEGLAQIEKWKKELQNDNTAFA